MSSRGPGKNLPITTAVEIGPGGVGCPAWEDSDGKRCTYYRGTVHVWNEQDLLFTPDKKRRPPWVVSYRDQMLEGLDG